VCVGGGGGGGWKTIGIWVGSRVGLETVGKISAPAEN